MNEWVEHKILGYTKKNAPTILIGDISIDCDENRSGLCYESFEYSHAVAGNCPMIA